MGATLVTTRRHVSIPTTLWAPLMSGLMLLLVGGLGMAFARPWLFPSLGPTAYLQTVSPERDEARLYHVIVGHGVGIAAGFLAVFLLHPASTGTEHLTMAHVLAGFLAVALTIAGGMALHADHAPACSTTLMITLGVVPFTRYEAVILTLGVLLVGITGEALRRLRLRQLAATASSLRQ